MAVMADDAYRAVVDNVSDGIAINVGSTRVFVNRAFLTIHGMNDESQAIGSEVDQFVVAEDKGSVRNRTLARQRGRALSPTHEFRIRRLDGIIRWVESSSAKITHAGAPASLSILRDITERKEAELEVARQANGKAQQVAVLQTLVKIATTIATMPTIFTFKM